MIRLMKKGGLKEQKNDKLNIITLGTKDNVKSHMFFKNIHHKLS